MKRTLVSPPQAGIELSPGVSLRRIQPGGRRGPNDEVLAEVMGGQLWTEMFMFGPEGELPLCVPDIRLPANQYWPLHFHDCWIAVIVLDGSCMIGDWPMAVGDVLISRDKLEYGPLVIGPSGCQMFEIFGRLHPDEGGYALEYRDHPTLQGSNKFFYERSELNRRNDGRQVLPVDGTDGLTKGRLAHGSQWDLGPADDPERAIVRSTFLAPGERIAPHARDGWHATFVLGGDLTLAGRPITTNDILIVRPDAAIGEIVAGAEGARLLEVARTAVAIDRRHPAAV